MAGLLLSLLHWDIQQQLGGDVQQQLDRGVSPQTLQTPSHQQTQSFLPIPPPLLTDPARTAPPS